MNLPNRLTILRVCLIPVFVVLVLLEKAFWWSNLAAVAVFLAACVTDFFDGRIARKYNLVTNFGKFMDPLADKLLVCSALICLVYLERIPTWVVILIVAREFIISGFRLVASEQGIVLAASKLAKVKTFVQMVMVVALVLNLQLYADLAPWLGFLKYAYILEQVLIYAALVLTVVSLIEYLVKNRNIMKGQM